VLSWGLSFQRLFIAWPFLKTNSDLEFNVVPNVRLLPVEEPRTNGMHAPSQLNSICLNGVILAVFHKAAKVGVAHASAVPLLFIAFNFYPAFTLVTLPFIFQFR
jgi:hypothetical protein